jgi:GNAT superfamily N-acetyltransferase
MFEYRMATEEDLVRLWEKDIAENPGDARYLRWREQYLAYNRRGEAHTFTVLSDGDPVGQITLLRSPECSAVRGRPLLCNGRDVGNMNAFRIEKPYEGQGHISRLVRMAEAHAASLGYRYLTIGCEAAETRTLAIYLHLGYTEFVTAESEDGTLVLYYQKRLG